MVIDNNSSDATAAKIELELNNFSVSARFIKNDKNRGFAGGHNQGLAETKTEFALLLNQDIYLAPDYFEKVVGFMEARPEAAAGQGILCRWEFPDNKTDKIDSSGLKVFKNRRVIDDGAGQRAGDFIKSDAPFEVFGLSGALPMFRLMALQKIAVQGEIFDEDFFCYKEDVDLAYRLRSAGYKSYIIPGSQAWHARTAPGQDNLQDEAAVKFRANKRPFINYHSYKNHFFVLIKNEYWQNLLIDFPRILWYEIKKLAYVLFFEQRTLATLWAALRLKPKMLRKHTAISKMRKITYKEMRKWFT